MPNPAISLHRRCFFRYHFQYCVFYYVCSNDYTLGSGNLRQQIKLNWKKCVSNSWISTCSKCLHAFIVVVFTIFWFISWMLTVMICANSCLNIEVAILTLAHFKVVSGIFIETLFVASHCMLLMPNLMFVAGCMWHVMDLAYFLNSKY